ncbi:uncharacterized protein CDV56_107749 [Aspergillus thermomutatus]|uniref:Cytochrome P450 monooxygenase n=1 Tax=Aspergillus thermomutatus TaxID=41047 RepID=A0A397GWF4_ASPTH|nr:uncharacterized protein CDV56_107749 [Aspergillus thermomutatus]RHZ55175.1 hypothetical protein CDV56_107749 [Aspergillus thermomutatus]
MFFEELSFAASVSIAFGALAVGLLVRCIYDLFFHPLRKFPGPKLAAIGSFYEFYYDVIKDGTYLWEIEKMHRTYGPVVRINSRSLHIHDPDYFNMIYAGGGRKINKEASAVAGYTFPHSTIATLDHDLHRKRRAIVSPYFSKRAITGIEPLINERLNVLCARLRETMARGVTVDLTSAFSAFTADVVTYHFYGSHPDYLGSLDFKYDLKDALTALLDFYHITRFLPIPPTTIKNLPLPILGLLNRNFPLVFAARNKNKRMLMSFLNGPNAKKLAETDSRSKSVIVRALTDPSVPLEEKSLDRLLDEGETIIFAGIDTTARTLAIAMFHLLNDKRLQQRLRQELDSVGKPAEQDWTTAELEALPYMRGVVHEALRLSYGLVVRIPRISTEEVLQYKDYSIPPGTPVSQSTYLVNNDPTIFPNPHVFDPERWIRAAQDGVNLEKYMVSFSKGSRGCLGINLAYAKLYLGIANVATRLDMDLVETKQQDIEVYHTRGFAFPKEGSGSVKAKVTGSIVSLPPTLAMLNSILIALDACESSTTTTIILTILVLLGTVIIYPVLFRFRYPANLPRAGEPPGKRSFSWRTRWRYYTDCEELYKETYETYTKHGRTALLPGLGFRHEIILPQSAMKWVLARPEAELSHVDAVLEVVQLAYALGDAKYKADPWPCMLVKADINAKLEAVGAVLDEELRGAFDRYFGTDGEGWREVDLLPTVRMVVAQAASRFTVGLPLCRDEEYLRDCWKVVDGMVMNGGLTGALPRALRPILGPAVTWKLRQDIQRIRQHFAPLYHQRLSMLDEGDQQDKPQDLLQKMLEFARNERPDELRDLDSMTRRLCFANFAAVHQTSLLVTNILLNVLDSDHDFDTVAALRDEVHRIIGPDGTGQWTKSNVARMFKADSIARETLRLHSNTNRGVFRKVLVDGLTTEDGIKLPRNSYVSFLARPLQCDPEKFESPLRFDPFRFSRLRETASVEAGTEKPRGSNLSFVSTSPEHLPFGHGNHSCPGRFLVDFEVKMILAYVLNNYEIQFPADYGGRRPASKWVAEALAPPAARIRVRRRAGV